VSWPLTFLSAAITVAQPTEAERNTAKDQEIVVIGERLKDWEAKFRTKGGQTTCRITKSTGDEQIDAVGCQAMTICFDKHMSDLVAASNAKGSRDEKRAIRKRTNQLFTNCTMSQRDRLIENLVDQRINDRDQEDRGSARSHSD